MDHNNHSLPINDIAAQAGAGAATVEQQHDSSATKNTPSAAGVNLPDISEAGKFVGAIIRDDRPGIDHYTYQTFDDAEKKRPAFAKIFHGKGNAAELTRLNAAGAGIFVMINAGDGKGRKAENVTRVRAVFVDIDKDGPVVLAPIAAGEVTPHIIVESSPEKFHVYWLVDRDFPLNKFSAVQAALAQKFGTDNVKDLPRVLRLPGFYHRKGEPFQVRIVKLNDHPHYSIEQIVDGLGLTLDASASVQATEKPAAPTRDADVIDPDEKRARQECDIALAEVALADEGTRNNALLKFIYTLRDRGISKELCFEYGLRFANDNCSPAYDSGQARATIRSAIRSARNPAGSRSEIDEVRGAAIAQDFEELPPDPEQTPGRFVPVSAFEFAAKPSIPWIVKRVLPRAEIAVVFGESGSGKSFFTFDIVSAVARGTEWNGRKPRPGRVVYIVAEGAGGFMNRIRAYVHHHGINEADYALEVIGDAPNLLQAADVKELIAGISKSGPADIVVIDTLAATTPGGNESSSEDMGRAIGHCKAIHRATGALVLLIHHSGKDQSKGARGWSGLKAAVDVEIEITRSDNDRVATVTKLKDGEDGEKFGFRLLPVSIGTDEDGDVITSCVVQYDQAAAARVKQKAAGKGRHQRDVLAALTELQQGEELPDFNTVVEAAVGREDPPEQGKTDRRRGYKFRALTELIKSGQVEAVGNLVRIAR